MSNQSTIYLKLKVKYKKKKSQVQRKSKHKSSITKKEQFKLSLRTEVPGTRDRKYIYKIGRNKKPWSPELELEVSVLIYLVLQGKYTLRLAQNLNPTLNVKHSKLNSM